MIPPELDSTDIAALILDKYDGDAERTGISADLARLAAGEPLAYVIGWIPFLNLRIYLDDARPLIPRPETEWWTEKLIAHLKYKFEDTPFTLLDLCAGSGAIGLAVLAAFPQARVFFGEIEPEFKLLIQKNIRENSLNASHAEIKIGDTFEPFLETRFDVIATNPPYIPQGRNPELSSSVSDFEPHAALFSGPDGLTLIRRIIKDAASHLHSDGELWMECDISNIAEAENLLHGVHPQKLETSIQEDQYGRPRLIVAHF